MSDVVSCDGKILTEEQVHAMMKVKGAKVLPGFGLEPRFSDKSAVATRGVKNIQR